MASENKLQEYAFEQMNLQVGGRIQLITHRTLRPMQHFSSVIGWVRDEYMIVKIPMENNGPISITEGDKLTVRVFSGVNVCSFSTVVQRVFLRPLMYAHVAFPGEIQGTSLRAAMRVKVEIPAKMSRDDGSHASVFMVNLSVSGALIESAQPLSREGETVQLDFTCWRRPMTGKCASIRQRWYAMQQWCNHRRWTGGMCSAMACNSPASTQRTSPCCKT